MITQLEYIGYKDLPKELKEYVDSKLPKEGEVVRFEGLGIKYGNVADYSTGRVVNKRAAKMKNSIMLSTKDTIKDRDNNPVKIGVVAGIEANPSTGAAEQRFKTVVLKGGEMLQLVFTRQKATSNMDLFAFLTLTNQNESNLGQWFHSGTISPKFKRLDRKKSAEEKLAFEDKVDEAKKIVKEWDADTLFRFAKVAGWSYANPKYYEESQLRLEVRKYCESKPELVLNFGTSYDSRFKSWTEKLETANALHKGKLRWENPKTNEAYVTWSAKSDAYEVLREFILNEENREILEEFEKAAGKI